MRIRGRSLPFPPLITSPLAPLSDPSTATLLAPKTDYSSSTTTRQTEPVVVLHPNADLLSTNSHASSSVSPSSSTSLSPSCWKYNFKTSQFLLKEELLEEKKLGGEGFAESRRNAAQVSVANRATNCEETDLGKPDCTMMKNKQKEGKSMVAKEKKTVRNPAVLLEGSRCSRVNGRGWRCCQPTLVGYLLCEHHLGKGRTRNMISNATRGQLGCTVNKRNLFEGGSSDEVVRKKRNIVPTVKARSISSLLDDGAGH